MIDPDNAELFADKVIETVDKWNIDLEALIFGMLIACRKIADRPQDPIVRDKLRQLIRDEITAIDDVTSVERLH